jgi:hypothetical protein
MSKEEMDPEEFLEKIHELQKNLPYEEYKKIEAQLPYGLVEHAESVRRSRQKKRWLVAIFVYLPIFILLVATVPQLILVWVILGVVPPLLQWLWDQIKPPTIRF